MNFSYRVVQLLTTQSVLTSALMLLLTAACIFVYWPGLYGTYHLDDFHNLETLNNHGGVTDLRTLLLFVFGNESGSLGRPVSMLSFLVNDQYWPGSPWFYKYVNLMIHLLCGLMILFLTSRIGQSLKLDERLSLSAAIFASGIWLLHPLNVSTTLYIIQRMTQLATLFSLIGLFLYVVGRTRAAERPSQGMLIMTVGVGCFGLLATLSKENGILIVLLATILEFTIFRTWPRPKWFKAWFVALAIAPALIFVSYVVFSWEGITAAYLGRDFTLSERLMTEARILVDYLRQILAPRLPGMGLMHDDIMVSTSLVSPITTLLSATLIMALLILALLVRKGQPVLSLAIFWFFGGHLLESTFIPLELYFEHRNYLPMVGPLFAASYYLAVATRRMTIPCGAMMLKAAPLLLLVTLGALTFQSSVTWSNPAVFIPIWEAEHPHSLRAKRVLADYQALIGEPRLAMQTLVKAYTRHQKDLGLPIKMINIGCTSAVPAPLTFGELLDAAENAGYSDGLVPLTKQLVKDVVQGKCLGVSNEQIHQLLYAVVTIKGLEHHSRALTQILCLHADFYVEERRLDPAIELLDRASRLQPGVDIPLRSALLLASAGLFDEALLYLNKAIDADHTRHAFKPSRMQELEILKSVILDQLQTAPDGQS